MEIRQVCAIVRRAAAFLLFACCPLLSAQRQLPFSAEVWGGYSYLRFEASKLGFADNLTLNGFNIGASLPNLYEGLGVAVDISGHYTAPMEEYNFLLGPQYSYSWHGMRFYGHGLFGKARDRLRQPGTSNIEPSDLHKALALGGGVDVPLGERFSFRAVQADYLITNAFGTTQHNLRFSTGLIVRFGKKK